MPGALHDAPDWWVALALHSGVAEAPGPQGIVREVHPVVLAQHLLLHLADAGVLRHARLTDGYHHALNQVGDVLGRDVGVALFFESVLISFFRCKPWVSVASSVDASWTLARLPGTFFD